MKRAGILGALLATAALMCAMPGILRMPMAADRTPQRLKPAKLRTLTVWLMPGDVGDRKLIGELCAAFEKQHDGVRVFLRVVTAEEWTDPNAVLPDAALFQTGDIAVPDEVFVPLGSSYSSSGSHNGVLLAQPLWLAPHVLSIPAQWTTNERSAAPVRNSLLASATAPPETHSGILGADEIPWAMLLETDGLHKPSGIGLQQLLYACPDEWRRRLTAQSVPVPARTKKVGESDSRPKSQGSTPTPVPAIKMPAKVQTLAQHRTAVRQGENLSAYPLEPGVSSKVRFIALCRENEDTQAFLQFMLENRQAASAHHLIVPGVQNQAGNALINALEQLYGKDPPLPNAFAHTREELDSLCADAFERCEDPVQTLLKLR